MFIIADEQSFRAVDIQTTDIFEQSRAKWSQFIVPKIHQDAADYLRCLLAELDQELQSTDNVVTKSFKCFFLSKVVCCGCDKR